ncbi:hypothetical protein Tco_1195555 [Tanacetum coccineum]
MNDVPYASTFVRCAMKLESPQEKPKTETLSEKELVSNKIQIEELSRVKLNARCSAILQNELPPKEKDLGSFVLPCIIGNTTVSNALTDLRASISVMSFSMFKRLGLGNPRPVDFVILDIIEDNKVPIILGRPMLATAHARIDVFGGKISLEVGKEQVIFNANEGATHVTVSLVCAIKDFNVIDNIEGPDDLEEFIMDDDLNGDLGNFRQDNNLIPNYENPGDNHPSPNKSLNDFIVIDDLWDNLDPGSLTNKQPLKLEFLSIGNRVNRYNPYNLQITCKIGFVNFNPYIDLISPFNIMFRAAYNSIIKRELIYTGNNIVGKARNLQVFIGCHSFLTDFIIIENVNEFVEKGLAEVIFGKPFKEKIGLEEDISKGIIWFKIGDDKTIFNMPRAEKRLSSIYKEVEFEVSSTRFHVVARLAMALADLGASISVMSFSMFKRLGLGNPRQGPYDLEEFLMDDELNGDLGNFRQDNNLIPNYENPGDNPPSPNNSSSRNWNPIEEFQDYDDNLGIGIEDFIAIDDLWDNLDPGSLMNKQTLKTRISS